MNAGIIDPVEESEWISPMVVYDNKTGEVRIVVDLRKLNDACLHDPFPTPFTNEVLEEVGSLEMSSFMKFICKRGREQVMHPCIIQLP